MYSFNIHSYTHRDICIFLLADSVKHSGLLQNPVGTFRITLSGGRNLSMLLGNICLKGFPSSWADVLFFWPFHTMLFFQILPVIPIGSV